MPVEWVENLSPKFNRVSFRDPCFFQDAQVFTVEGQGTRVANHGRSIPEEHFRVCIITLILRLGHVRARNTLIVKLWRQCERRRIQKLKNSAAWAVCRK